MVATIHDLDPEAYRHLEAHADRHGITVGEAMTAAIRSYLAPRRPRQANRSLAEWRPVAYPAGSERLSEEIDRIVYGE